MHTRQGPTEVLMVALGLASFACSDANGGGQRPSPSVCQGCTEILFDSALKPAAVAAGVDSIYVLKSQTSEIVAASLDTKQSRVLSDSVPRAVSLFLRNETLWATGYGSPNDSLWTVDTSTGATSALPELRGIFSVELGPAGTPVAAVRSNGSVRILALTDDGTIASVLWQLDQPEAYFGDFAASTAGVAWVASTSTTDTLYFASDMSTAPVSADARPGIVKIGTLTVANGTASLVELTDAGSSLFTLTGGNLVEQSQLAWQAMGMRTFGSSLLVTSQLGLEVAALDSSGKVLASQTLTRPLNIPATADSRYVYLPFEDAIAIFPRVGKWL